jgi:predicted DNA-binding protein (MmcQ/YjbR family)
MNIDFLRSFCNSLPGTTEDIKWEKDLCFSVGGKMFCVTSLEPPFSASFKVTDDEFDELSVTKGFSPAPYMARAKWVLVSDDAKLKKKEWEDFIRQSHRLVAQKLTKKSRKELKLED